MSVTVWSHQMKTVFIKALPFPYKARDILPPCTYDASRIRSVNAASGVQSLAWIGSLTALLISWKHGPKVRGKAAFRSGLFASFPVFVSSRLRLAEFVSWCCSGWPIWRLSAYGMETNVTTFLSLENKLHFSLTCYTCKAEHYLDVEWTATFRQIIRHSRRWILVFHMFRAADIRCIYWSVHLCCDLGTIHVRYSHLWASWNNTEHREIL